MQKTCHYGNNVISFVPVDSCKTLTPDKMASYTEGLHLSYTLSQLHLVKFYKAAKPLLQLTNIRRHNPHSLDTHSPEARGYTQKTLKNVKKIPRWVCTTASNREQSKLLLRSMLLILNLVCYLTSVLTGVPNKVQTQRLLKKIIF